MAQNPYVNKVIYGNQTVMDISGDTVTPSDVASGKTFHDASGAAQMGSYVPPTITPITPSNTDPANLSVNGIYRVESNSGKAVEQLTDTQPMDDSPLPVSVNRCYRITGNAGYLIQNLYNALPSDTDPFPVQRDRIYRVRSLNGYLYETLQTGGILTPTIKFTPKSNPNNPKTYTYDATKRYIITGTGLVSTALTGVYRTSVWYLDKGTLSERMGASGTNSLADVTNNSSTNTLTLSGTSSSYRTEFTVIQLD